MGTRNSEERDFSGCGAATRSQAPAEVPLLRGPWPLLEELGRRTRTLDAPSARGAAEERLGAVVVAAGEGKVEELGGIGPSLPDSFLSLASSSQSRS